MLPCGHPCGGIAGETKCMPCLEPECIDRYNEKPTTVVKIPDGHTVDDYCTICWSDGLRAQASVQLACGHIFHIDCILKRLKIRWITPRIVFGFLQCPTCKAKIVADHVP